jgi:hypothetical protein
MGLPWEDAPCRAVSVVVGGRRSAVFTTVPGLEAAKLACSVDRPGRVLVSGVVFMAWRDVGAEGLGRVGGGDVVLVAVGGDDRDVPHPLLALVQGRG